MSSEKAKKTSKINTWKPRNDMERVIERDGKLFVCHFDRRFDDRKGVLNKYERFLIGKESYINQLDTIVQYTNFFINNYDFENELVTAYLRIKFLVDHPEEKVFDETSMNAYIEFIYETIFTPTMVDKIITMVDENYLDDIETTTEEKKKYLKNEKKHLESLEFTNQHIKILLQISFGMKIMSPALFHYIQLNKIKIEKDSDIIFRFYKRLFNLFGHSNTYELYKKNGELVEENIDPVEVDKFINDNMIEPDVIEDTKYWYFTNDDGEEMYYIHTPINMYNKLYVYVNFPCVQNLVIGLRKTSLIAGTSC